MNASLPASRSTRILWLAALLLLVPVTVVATELWGAVAALGVLLATIPAAGATLLLLRYPETGVYVLFVLVAFGNEYSQEDWGVRSADDLTTIYNWRPVPALIASAFDVAVFAIVGIWLLRKVWRGERWPRLPRYVWPPLLLAGAVTGYATLLGIYRLQYGHELYHVLRELRPFLYAMALFLMGVDVLKRRGAVDRFWRLIVAVAVLRGAWGIGRQLLGLGRSYYGTRMVFYDYADTMVLLAGLCLLFAWLLTRPTLRWRTLFLTALLAAPAVYSFLFSFRRSFWLGMGTSLVLLLLYVRRRERQRVVLLLGAAMVALLLYFAVDPAGQLDVVTGRVASLGQTEEDPSNYFRIFDTENSLNAAYSSGLLGAGFGGRYEVVASVYWLSEFINHVSRTSHNGYLYLLIKMGALGLVAWTVFWLANAVVNLALLRDPSHRYRHVGLGLLILLLACAVANTFLPLYYNVRPLVILGLLCALGIAARQQPARAEAR